MLEDIGFEIVSRPDVLLNAFDAIPTNALPFVTVEAGRGAPVLVLDRASPFQRTSGSVAFEAQGVSGEAQTGRALFAPGQDRTVLDLDADGLGDLAFVDLFGPLQLRLGEGDGSVVVATATGRVAPDPFGGRAFGTAGGDALAGGAAADLLVSDEGADSLVGGAGDDVLFGDGADAALLLDALDGFAA